MGCGQLCEGGGEHETAPGNCLRTPNAEIFSSPEASIVRYFKRATDRIVYKEVNYVLWSKDGEAAAGLISDFRLDTISYHSCRSKENSGINFAGKVLRFVVR